MKKKKTPSSEESAPTEPSRRSFLNKLWMGLGILALVELAGAVLVYLRSIKTRTESDASVEVMEAGPVENFSLNSVTAFVRGKFYLCRLEDGGFLAVSRKCTHLGCTVPWVGKENRFACPCHASAFDIRGAVISPPAPRALDMYRVFIENNIVKVDVAKQIKRNGFNADQVVYVKKAQP